MNVNNKYLAINGSTSDVGGRILDTRRRNTTNDSKILIPSVTWNKIQSYFNTLATIQSSVVLIEGRGRAVSPFLSNLIQ